MTVLARISAGSETWSHCRIPRHRHALAYAAVVLSGGYEESGTLGRYRVRAGQVLLHRSFDAHLNCFESRGARVLNLLLDQEPQFALGSVSDPDVIERLAARDPSGAVCALREQLRPLPAPASDWPDALARDLQRDGQLRLQAWARGHQLAPATLSRGFRQVFAISPAAFRAELRTRAALALIAAGAASFATVAASAGFADQAHMTRAVKALTNHPPGYWRRASRQALSV